MVDFVGEEKAQARIGWPPLDRPGFGGWGGLPKGQLGPARRPVAASLVSERRKNSNFTVLAKSVPA